MKDVFQAIIKVQLTVDRMKDYLTTRPTFTIREALNLLKHREGFPCTTLTRYMNILQSHTGILQFAVSNLMRDNMNSLFKEHLPMPRTSAFDVPNLE
jgi:hypothetical protein